MLEINNTREPSCIQRNLKEGEVAMNRDLIINDITLFHGTCEYKGNLKRNYDGILWTAFFSTVAQTYIPESYGTVYLNEIDYWLNESVKPEGIIIPIAEKFGYNVEIHKTKYNRPFSWTWFKNNKSVVFTRKELKYLIEKKLGYKAKNKMYEMKIGYVNGKLIVYPSNYKIKGRLYILTLKKGQELKIYNYGKGRDIDFNDPECKHFKIFEMAKKQGYDGVKINDFIYSKKWGNIQHKSIGLFQSGIRKMNISFIEATNFDWDDNLYIKETPEYIKYKKRTQKAV